MNKIKIALTAFAFVLGIGATFASSFFPATLYVKTSSGECLKLCADQGPQACTEGINTQGYVLLQDCIDQNANFVPARKVF